MLLRVSCLSALATLAIAHAYADVPAVIPSPEGPVPSSETSGDEPIPVARLTKPPVATHQGPVSYPVDLRNEGVEGRVVVRFVVTKAGTVAEVQVIESTDSRFEDSAVRTIGGWKFRPGELNGRIVDTLMEIPLIFSINRQGGSGDAYPFVHHGAVRNPVPPKPPGVYDVSEVQGMPVALRQGKPLYPIELRKAREQGDAMIAFIIETDGTVSNVLVVTAPEARFGDAAAAAVATWRFHPATIGGKPVRCRVAVPIQFRL